MQVIGSCGPWWTYEGRYDHRSGACIVVEQGLIKGEAIDM